jgi:pyruvate dehydrogenase E1 component
MAFARLLATSARQDRPRIVPIIPDEARTFGMDPLFKEVGSTTRSASATTPVDKELLLSYKRAKDGQMLEEGITEAGSIGSFQAAGTSYATHGEPMIPFYIFYSMFGFQRTGDHLGLRRPARPRLPDGRHRRPHDAQRRGPAARGRPLARARLVVPNIRAYDPAFAYELAIIVREGIDRMYGERGEDVFYYITLYNENHADAARSPTASRTGVLRGLYRFRWPARSVSAASTQRRGAPSRATALARVDRFRLRTQDGSDRTSPGRTLSPRPRRQAGAAPARAPGQRPADPRRLQGR